jgi:poly-gamma-glutamate synthesis protein (capsule biosynthesis protein)
VRRPACCSIWAISSTTTRVDADLRNDLGLLWLVELDSDGPRRIRALPVALDFCFTRSASPSEADWIERRLRRLCAPFGTTVDRSDDEELLEVFV